MNNQQISSNQGSNRFLSRYGSKNGLKTDTKRAYDYKENEFPDLISTAPKVVEKQIEVPVKENAMLNAYASVVATNTPTITVDEPQVPPGWTQYTLNKNKFGFTVTHGAKTENQLLQEARENMENDPAYIIDNMITTLVNNWSRYKLQYDEIQ